MTDRSNYYAGSIDSHCHLSLLSRKELEPAPIIAAAREGAMGRIVDVGIVPSDLGERLSAFGEDPLVALTAGLHPTSLDPATVDTELDALEQALAADAGAGTARQIVAVGELGLDFYWSTENLDLQFEALERQWDLAARFALPVIIHNRDSEDEMLRRLQAKRPAGVMHCFSQGPDYCRSCLDAGMMISFGGNVTYKGSDALREAAALVPDDRLLVETDSPYLSPQSVRGTANHPGHLAFVIDELARVRGSDPVRIAEITASNARSLFGLDA